MKYVLFHCSTTNAEHLQRVLRANSRPMSWRDTGHGVEIYTVVSDLADKHLVKGIISTLFDLNAEFTVRTSQKAPF